MKEKISYAVKIDPELRSQVKRFCETRGLKQNFFVEKALMEQLGREELLEDMADLKRLRPEEAQALGWATYKAKRRP